MNEKCNYQPCENIVESEWSELNVPGQLPISDDQEYFYKVGNKLCVYCCFNHLLKSVNRELEQ